jgi:hypothetical protein
MLVDLGGKRLPQGHRVIGGPLGHKQPGMVAGHDVAVVDAVGQELGEEVGQGQRLLGRTGRRIFITLQTGRPTTPQPQPTTPQPQPTAPRLRISVPCCTTNHHPSAADCLGPGGPVRYCRLPALLPVQSPAISPRYYRLPALLPVHPPAQLPVLPAHYTTSYTEPPAVAIAVSPLGPSRAISLDVVQCLLPYCGGTACDCLATRRLPAWHCACRRLLSAPSLLSASSLLSAPSAARTAAPCLRPVRPSTTTHPTGIASVGAVRLWLMAALLRLPRLKTDQHGGNMASPAFERRRFGGKTSKLRSKNSVLYGSL